MKLPPFDEFIQARGDMPVDAYYPRSLPAKPTPNEVANFAKNTAEFAIMSVLEQYHSWLAEQLEDH